MQNAYPAVGHWHTLQKQTVKKYSRGYRLYGYEKHNWLRGWGYAHKHVLQFL